MLSLQAQNNWMQRTQTPLTNLQSPHNHPTSISAPPHLCSTSLQRSLFISRYPRSTTDIILATYNWSSLSICFTLTVHWTPYFSSSALSMQSISDLPSAPTTSCWLTTLSIHNSLTLQLPASHLPLSQIFPTMRSLPTSGLTART